MKNYFIIESGVNLNHAGSKARLDVEKGFLEAGMIPYNARPMNKDSIFNGNRITRHLAGFFHVQKLMSNTDALADATITFQYPFGFGGGRFMHRFVDKIKDTSRIIFLIHDLESVRYTGEKLDDKEINVLKHASIIIAHNDKMIQFLKTYDALKDIVMIPLVLFDYRFDTLNSGKTHDPNTVIFAGNLSKSGFLRHIPATLNYTLNLYGVGYDPTINNMANEVKYCGLYTPEALVDNLVGGYGLVWDGDSLEIPTGPLAEYTKINNPHKASLYLAAGLPIICWKETAIYTFVKENNVGIGVDNLKSLDAILKEITPETYDTMCKNALRISSQLKSGTYLKNALESANLEQSSNA